MTWFFMDVAFYGTNLNQSVILEEIGFSKGSNEYDVLKRNTIGNLIIAVAGYVPGYFVTILFIERLGRRWIQIQGFIIAGLMFGIIAGGYNHIGTGGKFAVLLLLRYAKTRGSLCGMTNIRGSSSSTLAPMLPPSLSQPKSFPRGFEVSLMASVRQQANLAQSYPLCFSTTSVGPPNSA